MKRLIIPLLLIFTCCATSRIEIDRTALKQVRSVAIAPFTSSTDLDVKILKETMEYFREALILCGFSVIGQEKIDGLLAKPEFISSGITGNRVTEAGRALGADAILTGRINLHEEENRIVSNNLHGGFTVLFPRGSHDKTELKTYLKFSITVELVSVTDGRVIIKITNRYPETERDEELPGFHDINAYRKYVLKKSPVNSQLKSIKKNSCTCPRIPR